MKLTKATITKFKSIEDSGEVKITPTVTVLVGQNESGKTAFLQALHKANSTDPDVKFDVVTDYPRRSLIGYQKTHPTNPAVAVARTYELGQAEIDTINAAYGCTLLTSLTFTLNHKYDNDYTITMAISEEPYLAHVLGSAALSSEVSTEAAKAKNVRQLIATLEGLDLNAEETAFLARLKAQFEKPNAWDNLLKQHVWQNYLKPNMPKFLYFDDYYLLPGKVNLNTLQQRLANKTLQNDDKTVLSLLRVAGVDLDTLTANSGYEQAKAKLEGVSNVITDRVFEYWTQNKELDVEIDIDRDPNDEPPFDSGNNLYIRIENRRHRVTLPFDQRSKGFIWFFSFLVWFDGVKEQLGTDDDLILLLDEPGLSLHALGQADLLRYIDALAQDHQIIYTTHSPFMVQSDRLNEVRTVEDRDGVGTKISDNVSGSDPRTLFPLQAALGYTIAQNLFIGKRNLLVEGPADLLYLQFFSDALDKAGRESLRPDVTVVPTGGLDKLATFVALLGANDLELVVLHDYAGKPEGRLESLVRERIIEKRHVLNYAPYRAGMKRGGTAILLVATDVEDVITPTAYLKVFNAAYKQELNGTEIAETDLPPGDRIVQRIERQLTAKSIQLRPSGGFNHYRVANYLISNPGLLSRPDAAMLNRFEQLVRDVNGLYSRD